MNGSSSAAAALAAASSASGCTIDCTPTGASMIGAGMCVPSTLVRSERTDTSRSMRGTICQAAKASRLARIVRSAPAPPET